jgi:hypothetical protein
VVVYNAGMSQLQIAADPTRGRTASRSTLQLGAASRISVVTAVWLSLVSAACKSDAQAEQQKQSLAAWALATSQDPDLADPLGQAIVVSAKSDAPGWHKVDHLFRGSLEERGKQAFLVVLPYGHCYRFLAVGGEQVRDLDLVLFDANGAETLRDVTQSATPALGVSSGICPEEPSAMRVEARMRHGHGSFAIGLFRDGE